MKTVSNVIHDYLHVSPQMRARVQEAIDELGYKPNLLGRQLATGRSGLIRLAFVDISLPYFAELARAVSIAARPAGYRILLEETGATYDTERSLLQDTESGLFDGMLFQPSVMTSAQIAACRPDLPTVLLGEAAAPLTMDRVMIDNPAAAREITSHLIASGRRRIGFVGHEESGLSETSRQRLAGYQQALDDAGIQPDPSRLIATKSYDAMGAVTAVTQRLEAGLDVDALVCRDDLAAIGTLRALNHTGLSVPDDVAVTGWDDIKLSAVTFPSLTTVSPDVPVLATRALTLLTERIAGYDGMGRHEVVPHQIVVRESA
jgi:DNA-binding LacI/PurR family transcriptional regulator